MRLDTARREIVAYRLRAAGAERDVVFARATLVGMAFDGEGVLRIGTQPLRLLFERPDRHLCQLGRIALEEYAVADIDDEVLLAAWHGGARIGERGVVGIDRILGAPRNRDRRGDEASKLRGAGKALDIPHPRASILVTGRTPRSSRSLVKQSFRQP